LGYRFEHPFSDLLDDMKLAKLMRHPTKDLGEGLGIEGRAIGGDASQRQATRLQGRFEPIQKGPDVMSKD
jgi:hypothetical protein